MGREDTDVETFTTCSHELVAEERGWGVYWGERDVVYLSERPWAERMMEHRYSYTWGGATGIRFPKMKRMAIDRGALHNLGIGAGVTWESLDLLIVVGASPQGPFVEYQRILRNAGLKNSNGGEVKVVGVVKTGWDEERTARMYLRTTTLEGEDDEDFEVMRCENLGDIGDEGGIWVSTSEW